MKNRSRKLMWLLSAVLLVLSTTACAVVIGPSGSATTPQNTGSRLDMVLQDPQGGYSGSSLDPLVREAWLNSSALSSWFLLVERISDPNETVLLRTKFDGVRESSRRVGSAKYGFSTVYSADATIVFSLVDVSTGRVLASATGRGSGSGNGRSETAVRSAIRSGLHALVVNYSGGGA